MDGQICVLVAVAILEDCCMAFANMQVGKLWPMGLLFLIVATNEEKLTICTMTIYMGDYFILTILARSTFTTLRTNSADDK